MLIILAILIIVFQGCHLITEFATRVRSDQARQALVQVVESHRSQVSGCKKSDLEQC